MQGPKPAGYWSETAMEKTFRHLEAGRTYEVAEEFIDYDRNLHPVGERWVFAGLNLLPQKNGLSMYVQTDEGEWKIRFRLTEDEQLLVTRALGMYLRAV